MLRITSLIIALLVSWSACAQVPLTGAGKGAPGGGVTFQGPGDVFTTSPYAGYSCSRAFTAAYASANGNLCDLVDSAAPTVVICTLKALTTGKVDIASASCTGGVTPPVKCAAATGGVCNISKGYDQTGNGRDVIQTTAASQPTLLFSSTPSGTLPAINCGLTAGALFLATTATFTQAQPLTASMVYIRNNGASNGGVIGANNTNLFFGSGNANSTIIAAPTVVGVNTATDNVWHAINDFASGVSSIINMDGIETTVSPGTNGLSANNIRLCRAGSTTLGGLIAEAWLYAASSATADRNALNSNEHGSNGYSF